MNYGCALRLGECLEIMRTFPDNIVDMVMADPPYGTTACRWDSIIPLAPMWEQLKRLTKPNGAIAMTACQPFTSALVMSNPKMFRYEWVWEKTAATGFLNAKKIPLRAHENVLIFYKSLPVYNPEKTAGAKRKKALKRKAKLGSVYGLYEAGTEYNSTERYPRSVVKFPKDKQKSSLHPTQKPVALLEYMIKTYTEEGQVVLDFSMGSGTTGVACVNTKRRFIGIEKDKPFFSVASDRIMAAQRNL